RRGERVGDQVGGETAGVGDAGDVVEGRDDLAVGVPLRDEGAVDEGVLHEPEFPYSRGGEGEPDRAGPVDDVGLFNHLPGRGDVGVVHACGTGVGVDAGLGPGVVLGAAVPVEVVVGEVEDGRGDSGDRMDVVELETR